MMKFSENKLISIIYYQFFKVFSFIVTLHSKNWLPNSYRYMQFLSSPQNKGWLNEQLDVYKLSNITKLLIFIVHILQN